MGASVSSASDIGILRPLFLLQTNACLGDLPLQRERHLDLLEDWALSFTTDSPIGDNGVALTFNHGSGGSPRYRIYGSSSFKDPMLDQPIGQTCRSKGGVEQESTVGMTISSTDEGSIFDIRIDTDPNTLDDIFIYKAMDGSQTVIQFCVYVSLVNEATGEEVNFVETEIRFKIDQDGSISVDNFASSMTEPVTKDFTATVGLIASVCKAPDKGQGDTVSVCIGTTDPLVSMGSVETFMFEATDAERNQFITQIAFDAGTASSLTEVEVNDGTNFKFNTILKADFYRSSDGPTTVMGYGTCTMNTRRRNLQDGVSGDGEENVPVSLSFVIGGDDQDQVQSDQIESNTLSRSHPASSTHGASSSALLYMSVAVSFLASLLSLVAVWLSLVQRRREGRVNAVESKELSERSGFEDIPLDNPTWV